MKLIELAANDPRFKHINFNSEGITLIVGDGSKDKNSEGSSNGVGKTLLLGLIHHCLGANINSKLKDAVDWTFSLRFSLQGKEHLVERSADGKTLFLDGESKNIAAYREWLNECGAFRPDNSLPGLTFRALITRFSRLQREDCVDPLKTHKEPDFDAKLRTAYLLGLDCNLAMDKQVHKKNLDELKRWAKDKLHENDVLRELFRAGAKPEIRAKWLEDEIPRLRKELQLFDIAENYNDIKQQVEVKTTKLRNLEQQVSVLRFQVEGIEKTLQRKPDISKQDLLKLYEGLQAVFKPDVLQHFDMVEQFNQDLAVKRTARLQADKNRFLREIDELEQLHQSLGRERDDLMRTIQGKKALDEYATLALQVSKLEAEHEKLTDYLEMNNKLTQQIQAIKEKMINDDRRTLEYTQTDPLEKYRKIFMSLAERLYPHASSGILLENNTGENQVRYNLSVQIEGDDSDGINAARILCFDFLLLMYGANHTMDFLWHDNRLFADIDPKPRARWFSCIQNSLIGTGKQYIATINTENYIAMQKYLEDSQWNQLEKSKILILRGDKPENKLLGIQFGGYS